MVVTGVAGFVSIVTSSCRLCCLLLMVSPLAGVPVDSVLSFLDSTVKKYKLSKEHHALVKSAIAAHLS